MRSEQVDSLSARELFDIYSEQLELRWVAGHNGGQRKLHAERVRYFRRSVFRAEDFTANVAGTSPTEISPTQYLVGHMNLIHPNQIQVLGYSELQYLTGLREISRADAILRMIEHGPVWIVVAEGQDVPGDLAAQCELAQVPLLTTPISSDRVTDTLHYHLSNVFADVVTLHGVFMEVAAIGVLLMGPPGVGKSELALELITRGHRLVADDVPEFSRIAPDIIDGRCPELLADFLEVRGMGIVNVRELFGDSAIKRNKYLRLIVSLLPVDDNAKSPLNRLEGTYQTRRVLEIEVPEITLPVAPGRNLAVMVECAARNHLLRMSGYDAAQDFMERQAKMIADDSKSA